MVTFIEIALLCAFTSECEVLMIEANTARRAFHGNPGQQFALSKRLRVRLAFICALHRRAA